jgi:hypothetical protein
VRSENALLGALIDRGRPVSVAGEELTVAFAPTEQFLKKKAEVAANRTAVNEALGTVAGGRWRLAYELSGEPGQPGGEEAGRAPSDEDLVRRLMEEFDAEELTERPSDNGAEGRSGGEAD